jgi:hypothetical protein
VSEVKVYPGSVNGSYILSSEEVLYPEERSLYVVIFILLYLPSDNEMKVL